MGTTLKNTPPEKHDCNLKKVVVTGIADKKDGKENVDVKAAASSEGADEHESDTLEIGEPLNPVTAERQPATRRRRPVRSFFFHSCVQYIFERMYVYFKFPFLLELFFAEGTLEHVFC